MSAARGGAQPPIARTKLVCTIGPASVARLGELVGAGMSVARLNLSHGDPASHRRAAAAIRAAAAAADREVGILADLPGPKVRLGPLRGGEAELETGASFELRPPGAPGDARGAATTHADLVADLEPGDRVLLADGAVELRAGARSADGVTSTVERGGTIRSGSGVSVPSQRLSLPPLTARDRELLPLLDELAVDFVGQSFVRSPDDVADLRAQLGPNGPLIVAKIETRPAVERVDEILAIADAIMVARGDLGVELPFEEVPVVQKRLVAAALSAERPAIVATQMLESMTAAPRPTRAEASDVANAVLDGADAVMLSGETAIGAFPVLAAEAAVRIAAVADGLLVGRAAGPESGWAARGTAEDARAVILAAVALARADTEVAWIGCFTRTGRTARTLSSLRPPVPIVAVSPDVRVTRSLSLHRAVLARTGEPAEDGAGIGKSLHDGLRSVGARAGERAVLLASSAGGGGGPNLVEVVRLG